MLRLRLRLSATEIYLTKKKLFRKEKSTTEWGLQQLFQISYTIFVFGGGGGELNKNNFHAIFIVFLKILF